MEYIHKRYGVLTWKDVLAPAIKIARNGFVVTADLIRYMDSASSNNKFLTEDPAWSIEFAPHGRRVELGETITRHRLANTLEMIAQQGADAFYGGPLGQWTIAALQRANGTMTLDDLRNYTVAHREPAQTTYRGYKLTSCGAPASGGIALTALKVIEGYNSFGDPAAVNVSTHRLNEAFRWAYGARANLGDPSFVPGLATYQKQLLSDQTVAEIRSKIWDNQTHDVAWCESTNQFCVPILCDFVQCLRA
jgi:gamma-glutamyltranspeptidase/glutathione hydrolase